MCLVEGFDAFASGKSLPFVSPQFCYKRKGARPARGENQGYWWAGRALQAGVVPWAYLQGCGTMFFLSQMQPNSSLFQEGDKRHGRDFRWGGADLVATDPGA